MGCKKKISAAPGVDGGNVCRHGRDGGDEEQGTTGMRGHAGASGRLPWQVRCTAMPVRRGDCPARRAFRRLPPGLMVAGPSAGTASRPAAAGRNWPGRSGGLCGRWPSRPQGFFGGGRACPHLRHAVGMGEISSRGRCAGVRRLPATRLEKNDARPASRCRQNSWMWHSAISAMLLTKDQRDP